MAFSQYRTQRPPHLRYAEIFTRNVEARKRFVITSKDGAHLIGVPSFSSTQDPTSKDPSFVITTASSEYEIPFSELAHAEELVAHSGLHGGPAVPEPCQAPVSLREKHQKFKILDAPGQLNDDLGSSHGKRGNAVLFLDIDKFKALNTKHTERAIDRSVLPQFQQLIADTITPHGFAYAEGGDEVIVLLLNVGTGTAIAFAEELRLLISAQEFTVEEQVEKLTVSIGLAHSSNHEKTKLADAANTAKARSKERDRDCITIAHSDGFIDIERGTLKVVTSGSSKQDNNNPEAPS
ncbi:diguanylate cyclase [Archangium sp. Cb G35]|uniref:diguanylate cyclase n=1 Tax=Archangium sp. Cb G35 TaxID=1920190 RepID=UPI0009F8B33B|nr:diguanylate cyclase [Archangium sp. Cb G35]